MAVGVGIDIGSRTTRIARIVRNGTALQWAASLERPSDAPDLPLHLAEARIRTRGGVVGLSGPNTILRYSRVPLVPDWKLKMLVAYEATQGGEFDASFDYRLLNLPVKAESTDLTLLTAVAKNDTLNEHLADLAQRGIKGIDFVPDALALHECFTRCPESNEALDQYCLVLDIGASKTEMILVYNGGLIFARSIAFGGTDFTKAVASALGVDDERAERLKTKQGELLPEDEILARPSAERPLLYALAGVADEFFGAIRASLMFARAQTKLVKLDVGRVYFSGTGARLKGTGQFLARKLSVRATPFRPPDDWAVPAEPGQPGQWMIALGLALLSLQSADDRISILPPRARKRRRFWRHDIFAYAAALLFIAAAAAVVTVHLHNWAVARKTLELRAGLLEKAAQRDTQLAELVDGNDFRLQNLQLFASAADSAPTLIRFVDRLKKSQQGPVVLSKLRFQAPDLNNPDAASFVTLIGSIGQSTKPHLDVLKDFWQQLTTPTLFSLERARPSADGRSLDFQVRIPLNPPDAKDKP